MGGAADSPSLRFGERIDEYVTARPYRLCRHYECGTPVKEAEGNIGADGRFNICWKRGLNGGSDTMLNSTSNAGMEPGPAGVSPTHRFGHMPNHPTPSTPPRTKRAFTVYLNTYHKRTDGDDLDFDWKHESAAFALDIAPAECPPCRCEEESTDGCPIMTDSIRSQSR